MADGVARRRKVGGSALTTTHFLLLFSAMLVAAAGNTALQSVMPAIGRAIGVADFWVAIAYTWSAVLWVWLAPYWAERSDHHGRKALTLLGLGGFIVSMTLCGIVLIFGLHGWIGPLLTFVLFGLFRAIYGALGCATPSATQAYLASRTRRSARTAQLSALSSSFGLGTIVGPALAPLFVLPFVGLPGPLFAFAIIALVVFTAIQLGLPDDRGHLGRGRGAAMSYPSLASMITGASVRAATAPSRQKRLSWRDPRIRGWIVAGVTSGHAQAATLTCLGFFIIDTLKLAPLGAEQPIAIVMMAGAGGTLAAQWGIIPKLNLSPRALIVWGSVIAAAGLGITALASDLYGLVLGFGIASIGFGFTRPGFTAGASLAVPLGEQGGVAGVITSANGISYVAAPGLGMALYALDPHLPFGIAVAVVLALAWWGRRLA
ncbi:MFS transporter [Sphingomonas astaxanthinifaciens]|uniref:MFS transporter n=1 Tax=Sphingomonas astaxanthinifaciens DSM 22298 TaxID=1123267 RepID=A0ABQ5Z9Z3_9SPHN|nr:MFS transporter [Sphingomonas astaxanthinifaciens]GLR48311.1 MFS transporter [Sphingomonas astaxanthinifaciens DSM 22298]